MLFGLLLFSAGAQSQSDRDKRRLAKAVKVLSENNIPKAKELFAELKAPESTVNALSPEAEYYYALCCFRLKLYPEAEEVLNKTLSKTNSPGFMAEAWYLLADCSFRQNRLREAMNYLSKCPASMNTDAGNMARFYLTDAPLDSLQNLYARRPHDPVLTEQLALRLSEKTLSRADRGLAVDLARKISNPKLQERINASLATDKGVYKVALLLPFNYKTINYKSAARSSQFILDLYSGISLATLSLADSGIGVELFVYDTEKSAAKIKELLTLPEMKDMDLLLGPVYAAGASEMAAFAAENKIVMVNPLSNKMAWPAENNYAYLSQPTLSTISKRAARYAQTHLDLSRTTILRGVTSRDSVLAFDYRQAVMDAGGGIALFKKITKNNAANLPKYLIEAGLDSTGHIFVTNEEPLVKVQLIAALELLKLKMPVFTFDDWLFSPVHTFAQWEQHQTRFIFPDFIDLENPAVLSFRERYKHKMNLVPSKYAYMGNDILFFFGQLLGKAGSRDIVPLLKSTAYKAGNTMSGFSYAEGTDNQSVPIYKLEAGQPLLETVSGN